MSVLFFCFFVVVFFCFWLLFVCFLVLFFVVVVFGVVVVIFCVCVSVSLASQTLTLRVGSGEIQNMKLFRQCQHFSYGACDDGNLRFTTRNGLHAL